MLKPHRYKGPIITLYAPYATLIVLIISTYLISSHGSITDFFLKSHMHYKENNKKEVKYVNKIIRYILPRYLSPLMILFIFENINFYLVS